MSKSSLSLVAALVCCGLAGQASAYSFSPKGRAINGTGVVGFIVGGASLNCTATFNGASDAAGVISISKVTFTRCAAPLPTGLPWTLKATGAQQGRIGVRFTKVLGGVCGPGFLTILLPPGDDITAFAFDNVVKGSCRMRGVFTSKQNLQIVK